MFTSYIVACYLVPNTPYREHGCQSKFGFTQIQIFKWELKKKCNKSSKINFHWYCSTLKRIESHKWCCPEENLVLEKKPVRKSSASWWSEHPQPAGGLNILSQLVVWKLSSPLWLIDISDLYSKATSSGVMQGACASPGSRWCGYPVRWLWCSCWRPPSSPWSTTPASSPPMPPGI